MLFYSIISSAGVRCDSSSPVYNGRWSSWLPDFFDTFVYRKFTDAASHFPKKIEYINRRWNHISVECCPNENYDCNILINLHCAWFLQVFLYWLAFWLSGHSLCWMSCWINLSSNLLTFKSPKFDIRLPIGWNFINKKSVIKDFIGDIDANISTNRYDLFLLIPKKLFRIFGRVTKKLSLLVIAFE